MHKRTQPRTGLAVLVGFVLFIGLAYGLVNVYRSAAVPSAQPAAAGAPARAAAPPKGLGTGVTPLGTVVTSDGRTLYRFDRDTSRPPASNCLGQCAKTWPPLLSEDGRAPVVDGVDRSLVGTVRRSDGRTQVTLKGWPLYTYSGDTTPGETTGEGVGGTWHAIGVDGAPVSAAPPAEQAPAPAPPAPTQEQYPSYDSGY